MIHSRRFLFPLVVVGTVACFASADSPGHLLRAESTRELQGGDSLKTNFNECLPIFGEIRVCQKIGFQSLEGNVFEECCDKLRQFIEAKCSCHPGFDVLAGGDGLLSLLTGTCKVTNPIEWLLTPVGGIHALQCNSLKTYNYGCGRKTWFGWRYGRDDMEIESDRLGNMLKIPDFYREDIDGECVNAPAKEKVLRNIFEEDIELLVPYGLGTFKGYTGVAEYMGIASQALTHGAFKPEHENVNQDAIENDLKFSNSGKRLLQAFEVPFTFFSDQFMFSDILQLTLEFEACNSKASNMEVLPNEGFSKVVETLLQAAVLFKRYGAEDICRYHTKYCSGKTGANGDDLTQFTDYDDCLTFMKELPVYTGNCTDQRPMGGNSFPCRWKHHWMIPLNPNLHCPHIGRDASDPNGDFKCNDDYECTDNLPSNWAQLSYDDNPVDIILIAEESNDGWEDEPFVCGFASDGKAL